MQNLLQRFTRRFTTQAVWLGWRLRIGFWQAASRGMPVLYYHKKRVRRLLVLGMMVYLTSAALVFVVLSATNLRCF